MRINLLKNNSVLFSLVKPVFFLHLFQQNKQTVCIVLPPIMRDQNFYMMNIKDWKSDLDRAPVTVGSL